MASREEPIGLISSRERRPPAIAIFARAPVAGHAKTRLIPLLGSRGAAELQSALILDSARKLNALARHVTRWLFSAGNPIPDFPERSKWRMVAQHGRDLGARLEGAFRRLLREHSAAIVIGTDSPTLPPRGLWLGLVELRVCEAVLGPCPDGGFYLIGLRRTVPRLFRAVRWGTRFAFRDMLERLVQHRFSCAVLPPVLDVDRARDLVALVPPMTSSPALRALAPATWRFLKSAGLIGKARP